LPGDERIEAGRGLVVKGLKAKAISDRNRELLKALGKNVT
jgi:hypothetical protein